MTRPTKDEVAAMVADRDAGTPGGWTHRTGPALKGSYNVVEGESGDLMICECWDNDENLDAAKARRIARVPQLEQWVIDLRAQLAASEAARVAAEARVGELEAALRDCVNAPMSGWTIAQGIARTALEGAKP